MSQREREIDVKGLVRRCCGKGGMGFNGKRKEGREERREKRYVVTHLPIFMLLY